MCAGGRVPAWSKKQESVVGEETILAGAVLPFAAALAAVLAWAGACALVRTGRDARALDTMLGGLRKVHVSATPRIGGTAVAIGIAGGATVAVLMQGELQLWLLLLGCALPAFVWGLIEDLSKRGDVAVRLGLTAAAGAMAYVLLDARLSQIGVPGIDWLLATEIGSFAFTVFAITGVAHAVNVVDGLNGLSGFTVVLGAIGLCIVAWIVGDSFVLIAAGVLGASVLGFLVVNFPSGRLFLGDGGAYLIGLLLAVLSVMLVQRNSEVSPWFPPVLLAYPLWETLFTMYRRKRRGQSTGRADALHLHSLVYRRIVRWHGHAATQAQHVTRNSLASACLWILPAICFLLALSFWADTNALIVAGWTFNACYVVLYFRIVRFRVPARVVIRAAPAPAKAGDEHAAVVR